MTASHLTLPGEGEDMATETIVGGPHAGDQIQGVYLAGADGSPALSEGTFVGGTLTPTAANVYVKGDQITFAQGAGFSGLKVGRYDLSVDLYDPEGACTTEVAVHLFATDPTTLGGEGTPFDPIGEINPGGASNYRGVVGNFSPAPWGTGQTLFGGTGETVVVADDDDMWVVVVAGGAGTAGGASAILSVLRATYRGPLNL